MAHSDDLTSPHLEHDAETSDLDRDERREARLARRARHWWDRRRVEPSLRDEILGGLFHEGEGYRAYLYRFSTLQALSIVIAVLGVLSGSPAIVIGAMLLAPLMTPVLAVAAALAMVWPVRAVRAALFVFITTGASVLLAWAIAALIPEAQVDGLPIELLSRAHPSLLDLVVALAAGAAGGYALVREEIGTALPGVAVAVALVPPLAVVGASLDLGRTDLAGGAMLLYLVNLSGIVLASGVVFLVTGFIPTVRITRLSRRVILTIAVSAIAVAAVAVPLVRGLQTAVLMQRDAELSFEETERWLGDRTLDIVNVTLEDDAVTIELIGADTPPAAAGLAERLGERLGRPVEVTVRWVERHQETVGPGSSG